MATADQLDPEHIKYMPLIFQKPYESLVTGRSTTDGGRLQRYLFDVPADFLPSRVKKHAIDSEKVQRKNIIVIKVPELGDKPDISAAINSLDRFAMFNHFHPSHSGLAATLINIFERAKSKLFPTLIYVREQVNPQLFVYAATVAIQRTPSTRHCNIPAYAVIFPNTFISNSALTQAHEQAVYDDSDDEEPKPIKIPFNKTATNLDPEHLVAYWREDVGVNQHHWHWHTVYPKTKSETVDNNKDRRGELFYYMHQQMLARYNFERLSNGLARVRSFDDFRTPIAEGYYPKLDSSVTNRFFPPRQPNSFLGDMKRDNWNIPVHDLERWRDEIINTIYKGYRKRGETDFTPFDIKTGINILGQIVEASDWSPNKELYGDLHNFGHLLLSVVHDPDNRFQEQMAVMGDLTTAMRDPIFYVWHNFINDIFRKYLSTLPPYTKDELTFPGVKVQSVEVNYNEKYQKLIKETYKVDSNDGSIKFYTGWHTDDLNIALGLNFRKTDRPIYVEITHLKHLEFDYNIEYINTSGKELNAVVRVFMAPRYNESQYQFSYDDQRHFMIELDKFPTKLKPGVNKLDEPRKSTDSTVTIPFHQIFPKVQLPDKNDPPKSSATENPWCKCGFPGYLLIPRGNAPGMEADFFVMITDADKDLVKGEELCPKNLGYKAATSYCGLESKLYPDLRAMGFPFDRQPALPKGVQANRYFLNEFVANYDNMYTTEASIIFKDVQFPVDNKD